MLCRDNRQYCAICYYTAATITGFGLSVPNGDAGIAGLDTKCGSPGWSELYLNYFIWLLPGVSGYASGGAYDHVVIPGGQCNSPLNNAVTGTFLFDRYCGSQFGCGTAIDGSAQAVLGTVCTNQKPFKISVQTDGVEYHNPLAASEAGAPRNSGFSLSNHDIIFYPIIRFYLFQIISWRQHVWRGHPYRY